jgi:hypothetical protein
MRKVWPQKLEGVYVSLVQVHVQMTRSHDDLERLLDKVLSERSVYLVVVTNEAAKNHILFYYLTAECVVLCGDQINSHRDTHIAS